MLKVSPKIIFFGTPDFAVASLKALLDNNFNVVAVVTSVDKPSGRGQKLNASGVKKFALEKGIPILQPERLKRPSFLNQLDDFAADLYVIVAFRMLPELVWNRPSMGTINVHASLLPNYRGAAPINWAVMNGEKKTGVTTFQLRHQIDTGDLLLQSEVAILPEDTAGTLHDKLMEEGARLLVKTIDGLLNKTIEPKVQNHLDEAQLKHAPKIYKDTCEINWENTSQQILFQIRGLSPYPGAFTIFQDAVFKIFSADVRNDASVSTPGKWETDGKTRLSFATKNGWIDVKEVQMQGKKKMDIADFLRGFRF